MAELAVWLVVVGAIVAAFVALSRGGRSSTGGVGTGAAGAMYDLLNEDKRRGIDIIVEEKAGARDPETADDKPEAGR
jgi:hypothetical protein